MRNNERADEGYQATSADFLRDLTDANCEIRDIISFLIMRRELIRDDALERLEKDTRALVSRLEELNGEALLEELECFKDILELHRLSIERHDKSKH